MNQVTFTQMVVTVGIAVLIPSLTAFVGILVSNGRFTDMAKRLDDMRGSIGDLNSNMNQHRNQIHSDIQMLLGWERERTKEGR